MTQTPLAFAAKSIYSPVAPYSEMRTGTAIFAVASYVIAKQLANAGKLDSFGMQMSCFVVSSGLQILDSYRSILADMSIRRNQSEEQLPTVEGLQTAQSYQQQHLSIALKNVSAAASFSGSFGLFSDWVLSQHDPDLKPPAFNAVVPITFGAAAIFKLITNSNALPESVTHILKPVVLTSMLLGSSFFQVISLNQRDDKVLFGLSGLLTLGILPQTVLALKNAMKSTSAHGEH